MAKKQKNKAAEAPAKTEEKQTVSVARPVPLSAYGATAQKRGTVAVQIKLDVHRALKLLCCEHGIKMEEFASDALYCAIDDFRRNAQ